MKDSHQPSKKPKFLRQEASYPDLSQVFSGVNEGTSPYHTQTHSANAVAIMGGDHPPHESPLSVEKGPHKVENSHHLTGVSTSPSFHGTPFLKGQRSTRSDRDHSPIVLHDADSARSAVSDRTPSPGANMHLAKPNLTPGISLGVHQNILIGQDGQDGPALNSAPKLFPSQEKTERDDKYLPRGSDTARWEASTTEDSPCPDHLLPSGHAEGLRPFDILKPQLGGALDKAQGISAPSPKDPDSMSSSVYGSASSSTKLHIISGISMWVFRNSLSVVQCVGTLLLVVNLRLFGFLFLIVKWLVSQAISHLFSLFFGVVAVQFMCHNEAMLPQEVRGLLTDARLCASPAAVLPSMEQEQIMLEVEKRLLRASQDDIGYRDFASYAAGARPIESLTSDTYSVEHHSGIAYLKGLFNRPRQIPNPPSSALKRDIQPGSCWPMSGSTGYIGIRLSDPVYITNVTVDHMSSALAREVRSAPRCIRVWGLVETSAIPTSIVEAIEGNASLPFSAYSHVSAGFTLFPLAQFRYDVHLPQHIQTFPVDEYSPALKKIDQVVFQVLDNWGSTEFTCLYRLRVHGDTERQL